MNKNNHIKLNSLYLSAFLLAKGIVLTGIQKEGCRTIFIFPNSNEVQILVRVFNFGEVGDPELLVDFKKVEAAIKRLKIIIHEQI
jgi:hypothetical protein